MVAALTNERRRDEGHIYAQRFASIDNKLDDIGNALITLARIDERQIAISENLVKVIDTQNLHSDRLSSVERLIPPRLEERLHTVETAMPGLREARSWVVKGVLSGVGMIGLAVVALVLK